MHAEYNSCLLIPTIEVLGFLAVIRLDSPADVDKVAGDIARGVSGDVGVSGVRAPRMCCSAVHSVDVQ